jgi:uroporphyrinogen-III synthase
MVRALAGWTIGVTADRRADEQQELLRRAGAAVVRGPTIRTLLLGADRTIRLALDAIVERPPEIAVLTTGIGTRTLFEVADSLGMADAVLEALSGSAVFARGPKASGAAQTAGLEVTWQAPTATSRELVDHLEHVGVYGRRIAVQLDGRARPVLGDELRGLGAEVVDVPVYRWTLPEQPDSARRLVDAVCAGRVDAVTFTSSPALWNMPWCMRSARSPSARTRGAPS